MTLRSQTAATRRPLGTGPRAQDRVVQTLKLPSVDQGLRHAVRYWSVALRNLVSEHRLHAGRAGRYAALVRISDRLQQRWQDLFGNEGAALPFSHGQSVGQLLQARIFTDLGFNFRHLTHLRHTSTHVATPEDCARASRLELVCSLQGAWCLNDGKAMVALRTDIHRPADEGGELLVVHEDHYLVRKLPATDLAVLGCDLQALDHLQALREGRPQIDPGLPGVRVLALPLAADLGRRYARISGDHHPAHAGGLLSRLWGVPRPSLQSLGLRNAVLRQLAALGLPLNHLCLDFAGPAHLGQTLTLRVQGDRFELVDETGRVVACGQARRAPV